MKMICMKKMTRKVIHKISAVVTASALVLGAAFINGYSSQVKAASGWNQTEAGWWYENPDGSYPASTWEQIDGRWYFFNPDGYMETGWIMYEGDYYYLQADGSMATGWLKYNGDYYFLQSNGVMAKDMWVDGYYVDSEGKWTQSEDSYSGWSEKDGEWYLYKNGELVKGWVSIGNTGNYYYFYTDEDSSKGNPGAMAIDTYVDGWYITVGGISNRATAKAKEIMDSSDGDLRSAYEYAASLSYSGKYDYTSEWTSADLAYQGLYYGTGNCYVMAATFYELALVLGYDAHQMAGYIALGGGGQGVHSWVEIDEYDGTWVYDANLSMQYQKDAFRFHYGKSGTWVYQNYSRMN